MRLACILITFVSLLAFGCAGGRSVGNSEGKLGSVELVIVPFVGDNPLFFDSTYQTPQGENYSLKLLRFFLSDIAVAHSSGKEYKTYSSGNSLGIYLASFDKEGFDAGFGRQSCMIKFKVTEGEYSDLRFNVGIPREVNHGDPSSAPAPLNNALASEMYWQWNSGYIFFLVEGKLHNEMKQPLHFAIGGDSRIMPFSFGNLFEVTPLIKVQNGKTTRIKLALDVNKLFVNGDKSFYTLITGEQTIVHGGYYADVLRNNLQQSMQFISSELIDQKIK